MFGLRKKRKEREAVKSSTKSYSTADTSYNTNLHTTIYAASMDDSYSNGSSSHSSHDSGSSSYDSGSSGSWD